MAGESPGREQQHEASGEVADRMAPDPRLAVFRASTGTREAPEARLTPDVREEHAGPATAAAEPSPATEPLVEDGAGAPAGRPHPSPLVARTSDSAASGDVDDVDADPGSATPGTPPGPRTPSVDDRKPESNRDQAADPEETPEGAGEAAPDATKAVAGAEPDEADAVAAGGSAEDADGADGADGADEAPASLSERRVQAVVQALHDEDARRVIDMGCGSGKLLARLARDDFFAEIAGTDVSYRALEGAVRRLRLDKPRHRPDKRVLDVFQSALTYADDRFRGYEAAVLMEVVEHIDPPRLRAMEQVVFGHAQPRVVVVTTPNAEHNVRYEGLAPGAMRHPDHRFEWTRAEFRAWADGVAAAHGYRVRHVPVGDDDPEVGAPTQMGVFVR